MAKAKKITKAELEKVSTQNKQLEDTVIEIGNMLYFIKSLKQILF
jgi:hypothetical protein